MDHRKDVREFLMSQILTGTNRIAVLNDADSLVNSGLVNSLSIVEIISYIEKHFGLDVADGGINISDFDSVDSICQLIERRAVDSRSAASAT